MINRMNKTLKNSGIYLIGTITIAIVSFFNSIILTRILSEPVYAQYGLLTSFVTASATVISLGMDTAYTRFFYESGYSPLKYLIKSFIPPFLCMIIYGFVILEPNHTPVSYTHLWLC